MSDKEKISNTASADTPAQLVDERAKNTAEIGLGPGKLLVMTDRHAASVDKVKEIGGPKGLEPTRYGDWESKGRCYDF